MSCRTMDQGTRVKTTVDNLLDRLTKSIADPEFRLWRLVILLWQFNSADRGSLGFQISCIKMSVSTHIRSSVFHPYNVVANFSERYWIRRTVCRTAVARLWSYFTERYSSLRTPFSPPTVTLKEVHEAVPKDLLRRRICFQIYNYWLVTDAIDRGFG